VFCYNVEPGVEFNYATGENWASGDTPITNNNNNNSNNNSNENKTYILNTKTLKFHLETCSSVSSMSDKNKKEYTGSRQDLIDDGYSPCGTCKP
jgi:DNA-entry nuclease